MTPILLIHINEILPIDFCYQDLLLKTRAGLVTTQAFLQAHAELQVKNYSLFFPNIFSNIITYYIRNIQYT